MPTHYPLHEQPLLFEEEHDISAVPMTASLEGRFGSRGLNPNAPTFKMSNDADQQAPPTPAAPPNTASTTVVISGGVSLGGPNAPTTPNLSSGPSKSDSASSWRRPSNAAPAIGFRSGSPPKNVGRQSPPMNGGFSSPDIVEKNYQSENPATLPRYRPQPIRLRESSPFAPSVTIDQDQGQFAYSKLGKPPSPTGSNSSGDSFKGVTTVFRHSQPVRQPRGPPASAEELTMKNFARRTSRTTSTPMVVMPEAQFVTAY